jgi:hypothetical protein
MEPRQESFANGRLPETEGARSLFQASPSVPINFPNQLNKVAQLKKAAIKLTNNTSVAAQISNHPNFQALHQSERFTCPTGGGNSRVNRSRKSEGRFSIPGRLQKQSPLIDEIRLSVGLNRAILELYQQKLAYCELDCHGEPEPSPTKSVERIARDALRKIHCEVHFQRFTGQLAVAFPNQL